MAELRQLKVDHPELVPAIDLQLALLEMHRRVLPRIPLPTALLAAAGQDGVREGRPLLSWSLVPVEWSEFRALLRETIDLLGRSGHLEPGDARFLTAVTRDGDRLLAFAEAWFRHRVEGQALPAPARGTPADVARAGDPEFDSALLLAFRPFLVRCAEVVAQTMTLDAWNRGSCPLCGGEPELAILSDAGDRLLVCARCSLRWPFEDRRCPFCDNRESSTLRSFASPDRVYRLSACDECRRYLKAYDERFGRRPAMPIVDVIATLPLDAVAMQRGYQG